MSKRCKIKSYTKFYKGTKLEVNNMHFSSTDLESYSKDYQTLADVFKLKQYI